jgi:cell division septum initiation protein DivIVA
MSKPIITKQMLIDADACPSQVDLFEKTFGDSVVVTMKRAEKVAHLFDWGWAIRLLDAKGRAEYERATDAARAELDRAIAPAHDEYDRATDAARAEYDRATAPARAEYRRAADAALAELKRATAPARAEYGRVKAAAWAELDRAIAPAHDEYDRAKAAAWATAFIDMHKRGKSK